MSKPAGLFPERQGRFPIRVELEWLSVEAFIAIRKDPERAVPTVTIDAVYVRKHLAEIVKDQDLSRYIL